VEEGIVRIVAVGLGAVALAAFGGMACGGEDDSSGWVRPAAPVLGQGLPAEVEHPVAAAIHRLQRAFADDDYAGVCAEITPAAARYAGQAAHGDPTTCKRDVRRLFGLIRKGNGWRHAGAPLVTDVAVNGSRATATVALDRRWRAQIPLTRTDGRWRLSGLFGAARGHAQQVMRATVESDFPPPGGAPVEVTGADGKPCPALSETRFPAISGGCRIDLSSRIAPLTMLTPLGDFKFDECSIDYRVLVDAAGRTLTDEFQVLGDRRSVACGDVNGCYDFAAAELVPWRGRIYPDGEDGFVHRMDMCLSTCVGYFVGELKLRLWREDGAWRAQPIDGGGDTGFRFDHLLKARGELDIRAGGN
jgi:hypothetical protein